MREIRFRAYYKPLKVMIAPDKLESINFETKVVGIYHPIENRGFHKLRMSDFVIMQYIGLNDPNDKKMFEGDVILCESNGINRMEHRVICYDSHQTRYKAVPIPMYLANAGNGGWTGYEIKGHNEVIGNIHEHPELLEREGRG